MADFDQKGQKVNNQYCADVINQTIINLNISLDNYKKLDQSLFESLKIPEEDVLGALASNSALKKEYQTVRSEREDLSSEIGENLKGIEESKQSDLSDIKKTQAALENLNKLNEKNLKLKSSEIKLVDVLDDHNNTCAQENIIQPEALGFDKNTSSDELLDKFKNQQIELTRKMAETSEMLERMHKNAMDAIKSVR